MPARAEQNLLLQATMRHVGYDMSKVDTVVMKGCTHCSYDSAQTDGRWVLADMIENFADRIVG